jgi:hypothetical protein
MFYTEMKKIQMPGVSVERRFNFLEALMVKQYLFGRFTQLIIFAPFM